MRLLVVASLSLALGLLACGQVSRYSGSTKATMTTKSGEQLTWESSKDIGGLDAEVDPETGKFHIKVDKSTTSEAAIAAASEAMKANADVMRQLLPLLEKAAALAATAAPK